MATVQSATSIRLTWTPIPQDKINGIIAQYKIEQRFRQFLVSPNWTQWTSAGTVPGSSRTKTFIFLRPSTDYEFRVAGSTAAGYASPPVNTSAKFVTTLEAGECVFICCGQFEPRQKDLFGRMKKKLFSAFFVFQRVSTKQPWFGQKKFTKKKGQFTAQP